MLKAVGQLMFPELGGYNAGYNTFAIDASGEKVAGIFTVPKTGNITKVGFRTGTVTTPQTLRASLQTVDAATGAPTGTAYGGSAAGTQTSPAANTFYMVTLGTQASATKGDIVAIVVEFDSTVGNLQIAGGVDWLDSGYPYCSHFTASWAKQVRVPVMTFEYDDGSYENARLVPFSTYAVSTTFHVNTTPDERALRFSMPFSCRIVGMAAFVDHDGDAEFVLYEGMTQKAIATCDKDITSSVSAARRHSRLFDAPHIYIPNTECFLSVKPTTTTSVTLLEITVPSAAAMDSLDGGQAFHHATRTDAGSWSKVTTQRPLIAMIIDQLDDGFGKGHPRFALGI